MFSIARHQGDDENEDQRSLEKKQERLNKLMAKISHKRKPDTIDHKDTTPTTPKQDKKRRKDATKVIKPVEETEEEQQQQQHHQQKQKQEEMMLDDDKAMDDQDEEADVEQEDTEEINSATNEDAETEEQGDQEEEEEQVNVENKEPEAVLEAFPDLMSKNERSKEDIQLLRSMGIPEWLLEPTMISPSDTCELDQAGLSARLVERCRELGLTSLFAVQMAVIPVFLRRQALYDMRRAPGDLCISAPTGSGKTLAYVLPIIDILSKRVVTRLRALVVLPTRDLVTQVKETFEAFVKGTDLKVGTATGQQTLAHEQQVLVGKTTERYPGGYSRVDILVTTPGRLIDHMQKTPNFSLQHLRFLVIDEADRLLNQSYEDWLNHILSATRPHDHDANLPSLSLKKDRYGVTDIDAVAPAYLRSNYALPHTDLDLPCVPSVQKLLFSATLTKNPAKIASLHLTAPEYISVQRSSDNDAAPTYTTPAGLKEYMIVCPTQQKPLMLIYLLHEKKVQSALCFTKSVDSTRRLHMLITAYEERHQGPKLKVAEFSSDLKAGERKSILKQFRNGEIQLLICSDLIGRGIDIDSVEAVVSYDVPIFMDKYIHRVGRTARAGREGEAYTLVETQEARHFKQMLREAGHFSQVKSIKLDHEKVNELNADYEEALASLASSE